MEKLEEKRGDDKNVHVVNNTNSSLLINNLLKESRKNRLENIIKVLAEKLYFLVNQTECIRQHVIKQNDVILDVVDGSGNNQILQVKTKYLLDNVESIMKHLTKQDEVLCSCTIYLYSVKTLFIEKIETGIFFETSVQNSSDDLKDEDKYFKEYNFIKNNIQNLKSAFEEQKKMINNLETTMSTKTVNISDIENVENNLKTHSIDNKELMIKNSVDTLNEQQIEYKEIIANLDSCEKEKYEMQTKYEEYISNLQKQIRILISTNEQKTDNIADLEKTTTNEINKLRVIIEEKNEELRKCKKFIKKLLSFRNVKLNK